MRFNRLLSIVLVVVCVLWMIPSVSAMAEETAPDDPLQILDAAYALSNGERLPYTATLTGMVQAIKTPYNATYKNITVTIVVEGAEDKPLQCYRMIGDEIDQIDVGDTISVSGSILNYNGIIEYEANSVMISLVNNTNNEATTGKWSYKSADGCVTITGYTGMEEHVVIPDSLDGLPVTGIAANVFDGNYIMKSVVIPKSITSCGQRAFGCPNLEAVYITDLESWCQVNFSGAWSNPLSYGNNLYLNDELVSQLVLPDTLTSIGGAFPNCTSIVSVFIPDSITSIAAYAFDGCSNLQHVLCEGQWSNITVGSRNGGLYNGGRHENATADALVCQTGCAVVTYRCNICEQTLYGNQKTPNHNYVDGVCTICGTDEAWSYEFSNGGIMITGYSGNQADVSIPETLEGLPVVSIAGDMFADINVLSVKIPASVTQIEYGYFGNCYSLTGIWVDEDNTVFSSDSRGVLFNKNQTQLLRAPRAINGQYTVPDSVTGIYYMAFSYCDYLTSVTIPASVTEIGDTPVYGSSKVTGVWVDENNTAYSSDSYGVLFNKDKTHLLEAPDALTGAYVIPDTVASIAESAFYHCAVESVTIPEGVTAIENCAFCCADITSVTIPASVTSIGRAAFNLCMNLTDVCYTGNCSQWENLVIADMNDPLLSAAPNLNHTYGDWVIANQPTFSACGQREKTCAECGNVQVEEIPMIEGKVDSWNVSLSDDLAVTFRMKISESVESTARVRIYVGNTAVTYRAYGMERTDDGLYVASVNVTAAQMSDHIFVTVLNGSESADTAVYTVRQYADTLLADSNYSQYHALLKEMLNYGAAAQSYFDYEADNLANAGITDAGTVQIPDSVDEELSVEGSAEGVSFYASSLVFRDKIALRYYFRFTGDITACTFTVRGKTYMPQLKNGLYYVEIADILPEVLDAQVELAVTDAQGNVLNVSYSPLNYIVRMNEKGSDSLKALLQALYNYHLAAKDLRAA